MVGIILAGGTGSRLFPNTIAVSKQLLPIYSSPLIFHPLTFLMKSGIREIVIITNPHNVSSFETLLGDGSQWGLKINILPQEEPKGIAEAYLIAEPYVKGRDSVLILGDNLFYGCSVKREIMLFKNRHDSNCYNGDYDCLVFGYKVKDPERYGVVEFDDHDDVISIEEKPTNPKSNIAAVGLYMCDGTASERVKNQSPSARGELEITDLMKSYLYDSKSGLKTSIINNSSVWLDAGTKHSYVEAIQFVEAIEERTGKMIACPEEIAYENDFITKEELEDLADSYPASDYKDYLSDIIK